MTSQDQTTLPPAVTSMSKFRQEIEHAINCNSMENGSDTPDFILAEYLAGCLEVFDKTVRAREEWYGRKPLMAEAMGQPFRPAGWQE